MFLFFSSAAMVALQMPVLMGKVKPVLLCVPHGNNEVETAFIFFLSLFSEVLYPASSE